MILRVDVAAGQSHAQGMVDRALAALGNGQPLVGPRQSGQDRKTRRVGGSVAERAELVGVHVPDRFLGGVPHAVGMRLFHAVGIGKQGRIGGPGHAVQLVGDVVVLVPNDQVRIAALSVVVAAAVGIRAVLVIALNDRVGRDRHGHDVALAGIVVDDDVDGRGAVAVDDIVRNAVQRAVAVGRVVVAPIGMDVDRAADVGNDCRGIGRHGRVG